MKYNNEELRIRAMNLPLRTKKPHLSLSRHITSPRVWVVRGAWVAPSAMMSDAKHWAHTKNTERGYDPR